MKKTTTTNVKRTIFQELHLDADDIKQALCAHAELADDTTVEYDISVDGRLQGAILRHTRTVDDAPIVE